jgi:hypothetical protein
VSANSRCEAGKKQPRGQIHSKPRGRESSHVRLWRGGSNWLWSWRFLFESRHEGLATDQYPAIREALHDTDAPLLQPDLDIAAICK